MQWGSRASYVGHRMLNPSLASWPLQYGLCFEIRQLNLPPREVGVGWWDVKELASQEFESAWGRVCWGGVVLDASVVLNQFYRKANWGSKGLRKRMQILWLFCSGNIILCFPSAYQQKAVLACQQNLWAFHTSLPDSSKELRHPILIILFYEGTFSAFWWLTKI